MLHSYKVFDFCNVGIEYGPELLAAHHLDQGLLIGVRNLCRFLQVHEVLLLALELVSQVLHLLQLGDAFEQSRRLKVLSRLIQVQADCLLDANHFFDSHVRLSHVFYSLHEHSSVRALLRFKIDGKQVVDLTADLPLVEVRVQGLQVLTDGCEQA